MTRIRFSTSTGVDAIIPADARFCRLVVCFVECRVVTQMGGRIGGLIAIALLGGFFYLLWMQAEEDRAKRDAQKAAYEAKAKAERDATASLLADPAAMREEIEKRLTSWIRAKGDFYLLEVRTSTDRQVVRTIPRNRRWSVECNGGVLTVWFQTISADEDDLALRLRVLPGRLNPQQCREYVEIVAERMTTLTESR